MKASRATKFFVAAMFAAALSLLCPTLRAQTHLTSVLDLAAPPAHGYIVGIAADAATSQFLVFTPFETYMRRYAEAPGGGLIDPTVFGTRKEFDLTPFNINLYEDTIFAPDPRNFDRLLATGGLTLNRLIVLNRSHPPVLISNQPMGGLVIVPDGMAIRPGTAGNAPSLFYTTRYGVGVNPGAPVGTYVPSIIYHPDIDNLPITSQPANVFGVGLLTLGVGAVAIGPDGLVNVIDTGLNKILRFDPLTFAHVSDVTLANTITDNKTFVITPNGHIFTASTVSTGGWIYNYYTGAYEGDFSPGTDFSENGFGGKNALTSDANGYVFAFSRAGTSEGIYAYNSNQLAAATPEPTTLTNLLTAGILGAMRLRRRTRRN